MVNVTLRERRQRNLAALVGDVHSPLGPQEQHEDGKVGVQHGTHIDDQESSCSSPVEDDGEDGGDGVVAGLPEQVRHWSGSGPVQVEQVEWQATHSADDVERYNLGMESIEMESIVMKVDNPLD